MNQATEAGRDVPSFFEKSIEFILENGNSLLCSNK